MDNFMDVLNEKTGEIFSVARPVIPFRTLLTADEYKDGEEYEPGSSQVDLTGFEPLASIVARCMRTMRSPSGAITQVLDVSALKQEAMDTGIYECKDASTVDDAFDCADPTDKPGFDFVDASYIMQSVNDNLRKVEKDLSPATMEHATQKANATELAVEKSELSPELEEKQTA